MSEVISPGGNPMLAPTSLDCSSSQELRILGSNASLDILSRYGKTFRLASRLLPKGVRDDAAVVYAFCRLVDDAVDEAESPKSGLADLRSIQDAFDRGDRSGPLGPFLDVVEKRQIPPAAVRDLLAGVGRDLRQVCFQTDRDLIHYSYQVAGTVGLMMARVLGVRGEQPLPFAIDLGIGMQLTNICRDVAEDARRGRIYLPMLRLTNAGTESAELLTGRAKPSSVSQVVREVLALAEHYYDSGLQGLRHVDLRSRIGIIAALYMYREIGRKLLRNGANPLEGRTVVALPRKLFLMGKAILVGLTLKLRSPRKHLPMLHAPLMDVSSANHPLLSAAKEDFKGMESQVRTA